MNALEAILATLAGVCIMGVGVTIESAPVVPVSLMAAAWVLFGLSRIAGRIGAWR